MIRTIAKDREEGNGMYVKYIQSLPIVIMSILIGISWYQMLTNGYTPRPQHWAAVTLCAGNVILYIWKFKAGLVGTGVFLVLSSLTLVSMTHEITYASYFLGIGGLKIATPSINGLSFGLLMLHCILNFKALQSLSKKVWSKMEF